MEKRKYRFIKKKGFIKITPELKQKALEISKQSGIHFTDAVKVAAGKVSINDVLKKMLAREKAKKITSDGIEPSLAGLVARGIISKEKALKIQELKKLQNFSFPKDIFQEYFKSQKQISISHFERGIIKGTILKNNAYTIIFKEDANEEKAEELNKHDIKYIFNSEDKDEILKCISINEKIRDLNLKGSSNKNDRFKFSIEQKIDIIKNSKNVNLQLRDGEIIEGRVNYFTKYEMGITLLSQKNITLFYHAILKE